MIDTNAFTKLVPGFDFLQNLMQGAGQAAPAMGQWIAPTLNPEELEKRIGELKTVQFWLEQNARMIGMTVQALEVQRMTLSTLQTMNLPMADLRNALTLPTAAARCASAAGAGAGRARAPRRRRPRRRRLPPMPPARPGRRGPDAVVGRADAAVHRAGHQGHAGQQRHRLAQPGGGRCGQAARGAGARRPRRPRPAAKASTQAHLKAARPAVAMNAFASRPRHPSRLAHGAVDGGRAGGFAAVRPQAAADARLRLLQRPLRRARPRPCWPRCASAGPAWPGSAASAWACWPAASNTSTSRRWCCCWPACRASSFRVFSGAQPLAGFERLQRAGACRPGHARPGRAAARAEPAHRLRLPVRRPGGVAQRRAPCRRRRLAGRRCRAWPSPRTWRWCRASRRAASRSGPVRRITAAEQQPRC